VEVIALAGKLRQRVERAAELGSALAEEIQEWVRSGLTMRTVIADDRLSWEVKVEAIEPPFNVWGRRFGDAVQNLRAALDNLVWGLATLGGKTPDKPTSVQFPIVEVRSDWPRESKRIAELPDAARRVLAAPLPIPWT
jgi:hypothetical protein